jgi:hypothetical protein
LPIHNISRFYGPLPPGPGQTRPPLACFVCPRGAVIATYSFKPDGYTGSEIESGVVEALYQAFDEDENESTDLAIAQVIAELAPLPKLMAKQIAGPRNWAKRRGRMAIATQPMESKLRKSDLKKGGTVESSYASRRLVCEMGV